MSNFRSIDRQTGFLLPPSVDEWLPEKHLARFIVEVIDGLDLRAMSGSYRGSGSAFYHPRMLLGILVYGYATGVFSSRKLERATYDSVAFRFIAANDHPDHDTIAAFRRRFLKEIEALFVQVLHLAHEMGVLKMGTIGLVEPLVAQGAKAAASVADACRGDAMVTMLANDEAVASVTLGEGGIIASLPKGAIHISSSTISVALSEALAKAHGDAGQCFVAAPVFGRPELAAAGQLFVVAAGAPAAIEVAQPIFGAIGQRTFVVSETPKTANLVKLSGNFLIATVIESLGEAMALVHKGGVDQHQYLDILTSTLFGAPVYKTYGALIADRKFEPAGFAVPLAQKDIRLALAAAEDLRVPLPIANLLRDRFLTLLAHGGEKLDWSAIGQLAAKDAGEA